MNSVELTKVFKNGLYSVDVITKDGVSWFRAADVTRILRYKNGRQAIKDNVRNKHTATKETLGCVFLSDIPPVSPTDPPR